jgi:hypothetical protein
MNRSRLYLSTSLIAWCGTLASPAPASGQVDVGVKVEKSYGDGLPRDRERLLYADDQYPYWPLTAEQRQYASISGDRMKRQVIDLAGVALRYRDAGHKWWGRLPGTTGDKETVAYYSKVFESLGMKVEHFPYTIPNEWRATDWSLSYHAADGSVIELATAFPVHFTKPAPQAITAEAIWVGTGAEPDFIGRDVRGKAVVIYSWFTPGGRDQSSDAVFDSNTRAVKAGAAFIVNVMGVPGNAQFQPEGGVRQIPQMTLSQDEGFALRDRLGAGEKVMMTLRLDVETLAVQTEYTIATLPGASDAEEIVVMTHTDGFFEAAMDNAAGLASALEIARFYAAKPIAERRRTMKFIQFPDHHHGEVARGRPNIGIDATYPWSKVALKLTMEHPSQTLLYWRGDGIMPTNAIGAFRWNALGSPAFETMVFNTLKEFGVSVYAEEDGPKNGNYAPSFHIIDHIIYHTSLDVPDLVPASGLERSTRAFVAAIDRVNQMTMAELRGPSFPPKTGQGTLNGTETGERKIPPTQGQK